MSQRRNRSRFLNKGFSRDLDGEANINSPEKIRGEVQILESLDIDAKLEYRPNKAADGKALHHR